jgi:hypothetical protein
MFETFILDADNGQILCTTKDKKVLTIKVDDFATYIPFQYSDESAIIAEQELQELILSVLQDLYRDNATKTLFRAKKYNIHYIYKGMNKVASYDNFEDANRQHRKMQSYGDLYSCIFPDFKPGINE